jgi:uncharacterized membrane protein YiaA
MTTPTSTVPSPSAPSDAFVGASWAALLVGGIAFVTGLWNAGLPLGEKGYYLSLLLYGLFAAVSLQKSVRDRAEGIAVSGLYLALSWISVGAALVLLTVGLWNADLTAGEKGSYGMSFTLSLFSAVVVQKNVRDLAAAGGRPDGGRPDGGRPTGGAGDPLYGEYDACQVEPPR